MKISAFPPIFTRLQSNSNINTHYNMTLANDVFVRSQSFQGSETITDDKSFEELEKWAEETDFLSKVPEIDAKTGRILGSGFEGTTYEIPNSDRWVLKKYKRTNFLPISNTEPKLVKLDDYSPELNIGQPVAQVQIPAGPNYSHVFYVLKKQAGDSLGVSFFMSDQISDYNIDTHIKSLKRLADAKQVTFDKCIKDIEYVTDRGYLFDCINPYNFMFDEDKQEIKFVDVNDKIDDGVTQYGEVLYALLDGNFGLLFNYSSSDEDKKAESRSLSNTIISKYINAMQKNNAKFMNGRYFDLILNSDMLDDVLNTSNKEERINALIERNLM